MPCLIACLDQTNRSKVIFAERTRRSESLGFRLFYALYRWVHLLLTGIPVRVGNFSVIPSPLLRRLVVVSELWNHYAAAGFKARVPRATVPTVRAQRLDGKSGMNFVSLVTHGLSALSVHSELIGVRLLVVTAALAGMIVCGLLGVLGIRLLTPLAIPGWIVHRRRPSAGPAVPVRGVRIVLRVPRAPQNQTPLIASFTFAANTKPMVSTRIKMGQTGNVIAVVKAGGKLFSARKEVKVTIGGCGG